MATHFLAVLRNIEVQDDQQVELLSGVRLHRDVGALLASLPPEFSRLVGEVDRSAYESAPACLAATWDGTSIASPQKAEGLLSSVLGAIQRLLMALWYVRDNCVMCDGGVLIYPELSNQRVGWHGIKHSLGQYFWNATVQHTTTAWAPEELATARDLAEREKSVFDLTGQTVSVHPTLPKGVNRLMRGQYYLENARTCSDVGVRIAAYVSCLEALFSTASTELAHKLSERVAVFLEDDVDQRAAIYQDVKRAYDVRSKMVHGDEIDTKQHGQLFEVSMACDNLLRRVFGKVLRDDDASKLFRSSKSAIDSFFLKRTLGVA
jgi:hypothetical protein